MAKRDLQAVVYTDDMGQSWVTAIDAAVFAQQDGSGNPLVGGADYTGSPALETLPRNITPRSVTVSNATLGKRRVVCLENTAPLYTGASTTINLQQLGAAAAAFTRYRSTGEKRGPSRDPNG